LPDYVSAVRVLIVAFAHLDRISEARQWLDRLIQLQPGLTIKTWRSSVAAYSPRLITLIGQGLRRAGLPTDAVAPLAPPDQPSIALLPFVNLSDDPSQEYFADGMVEEIITALSRIPRLFVIARASSFFYKGQTVDARRVGRELGVRYVLEGSVRKAGGLVRITARLLNADNNGHLWADRFEGALADIFELQDQVAVKVAGAIEPTLQIAETRRGADQPTKDLGAYDLYLRALPLLFRLSKEDLAGAATLLDQAISLDANFGPALAFASVCHMRLAMDGWVSDSDQSRAKAVSFARHAIELAGNDPVALANAAYTLQAFGEDVTTTTALVDRALALNPSYARGWYISAWMRLASGLPDLALEHIEKSLRLSPREYVGTPLLVTSWVHFISRRFSVAAEHFRLAICQVPGSPWPYRGLAACFAHLEQLDNANEVINQLRVIGAIAIPSHLDPANSELDRLLHSGLLLATGSAARSSSG
jgi:adenylate cyclase